MLTGDQVRLHEQQGQEVTYMDTLKKSMYVYIQDEVPMDFPDYLSMW